MGELPDRSLHSRYNPVREAQRFVDSLSLHAGTAVIVVCEPGESYLAEPLRRRFPRARFLAIRYQNSLFFDSDRLWDAVWRPNAGYLLESFLLDTIPDELLPVLGYIEWNPSNEAWPEISITVRETTRRFLETQKKIMVTRCAFGPRWLKNIARTALFTRETGTFSQSEWPVFLAGAGPSLDRHISDIPQGILVMAVSSSLAAFTRARVVPDICVATDGGYWALDYFRDLSAETCLAIPLEAAAPLSVLETSRITLLNYGSSLENAVIDACRLPHCDARRNGTVTGTALDYALAITSSKVYGAGLDFAPALCFSHIRGHRSEQESNLISNRMVPLASGLVRSELDVSALKLYARRFEAEAHRLHGRFTRLPHSGRYLEGIPDSDCIDGGQNTLSPGLDSQISVTFRPQSCPSFEDKAKALIGISKSIEGFFMLHSDPLAYRDNPEFARELVAPSPAVDFMQLARFNGYLDIIPEIEQAPANSLSAERLATEAEKTAAAANVLGKKIEAYAHGYA